MAAVCTEVGEKSDRLAHTGPALARILVRAQLMLFGGSQYLLNDRHPVNERSNLCAACKQPIDFILLRVFWGCRVLCTQCRREYV